MWYNPATWPWVDSPPSALPSLPLRAAVAQDRPLVFQVGAELVVLDVVANDASGRDVGDLSASEIQVVEDGSPRPVQQLQLIKRRITLSNGVPSADPAPASGAPSPAASRMPDSASLIIAVDLNSIPVDAVPRVNAADPRPARRGTG